MLIFIGLAIYVIGAIGLLIDEFKESIIWGLAGLFFQLPHVLFALLHFQECKKCMAMHVQHVCLFAAQFHFLRHKGSITIQF